MIFKNKVKVIFKSLAFLGLLLFNFSCVKNSEVHHLNFPYRVDKNLRIIVYDHKIIPANKIYGLKINFPRYRKLTENPEISPRGRELPGKVNNLKMLLVRINIKNIGKNKAYPKIDWKEKIQLIEVKHKELGTPVYMIPSLATKDYKRMNYGHTLENPKEEFSLSAGKEITVWMGAPIPDNLFSPFYLSFKIKGQKEPIYNIEIN